MKILQEAATGQISQAELCRKHGISPNTFYLGKRKYAGMEKDNVRHLKELEATGKLLRKNGFRPPSAGPRPSS